MVIEDSHLGRQAASEAGCHVAPLDQPASLTLEWIQKHLDWCNSYQLQTNRNEIPWLLTPLMNIVVPMSGKGSRFKEKGYDVMKPLLPVHGKPMIQAVIQNIQVHGHYSFICQKSHVDQYKLDFLLPMMLSDTQNQTAHIFTVDQITRGATESVLQAKTQINNEQPLIILNSDQWIEWDMHGFLYKMMSSEIDGGILVFEDHSGSYLEPGLHGSSKWSYAAQDEKTGWVTEIKEKVPISKWATVGLYYWKRGSDFVKYAEKMIEQDQRVNNEFYVAPVYNLAIQDGFKIALYECQKMYGLGTPEDYESFLKTCPYRIFG
jgi:dTDP-glucose pyrophosphorylase